VQGANDALLRKGREAERDKVNPDTRADLAAALDELDALLPQQTRLAKAAKDQPDDASARKVDCWLLVLAAVIVELTHVNSRHWKSTRR